MNLDFKIPMSGRVARKLAYASTIMKADVDANIIRHINDDLLTSDEVHAHVAGTGLDKPLSVIGLGVVQFVADCGYRALVGTPEEEESFSLLILSALSSGKNLLIVDRYHGKSTHSKWRSFLSRYQIPFVDGSDKPDDVDLTARIIVVDENSNFDYLRKNARDRIFVYSHHIDQAFFDVSDLLGNRTSSSFNFSLYDLCQDFEFALLAFHTTDHTGKSKQAWHESMGFNTMASCLFLDSKLPKAINNEKQSQKILNDSGISLTSPYHISKLLNVNVDLLYEGSAVGEKEEIEQADQLWSIFYADQGASSQE